MNRTIARLAAIAAAAFALSIHGPAGALVAPGNPDPAVCHYAPNITITQAEFAQLDYGDTFQEVKATVGGAGFPLDDDPTFWRRTFRACSGASGSYVGLDFHRVPGQGLVLFHTSVKWW